MVQPWLKQASTVSRLTEECLWVCGLILFWKTYGSLKRVVAEKDGLRVSDCFREEVVPYSTVASIAEWRWWSPRITSVKFRRPSRFGSGVLFVSYAPLMMGDLREHPVTTFIRERAQRAVVAASHQGPDGPVPIK
jgi:hypothetical protein